MLKIREIIPKINLEKKIPRSEFEERIENIKKKLVERDIDIGFIYGTHCMPGDIQYLCGYDPQIENVAGAISPSGFLILGGPEGEGYGKEMMKIGEWRNLTSFQIPLEDYPRINWIELKDVIKELTNSKIKRAAVLTAPDVMSYGFYNEIKETLTKDVDLIEVPEIMAEARYKKSQNELEMIGYANLAATEGMRAMIENASLGVRETELSGIADYMIKHMGCYVGGVELDNIVMSGKRLDTIVGRASNKKLEKGDMVVLGVIARYEGYSSVLGRTIVIEGANKKQTDFIEIGIKAYELAVEKFLFDQPSKEIEISARNYLESKGYSNFYSCGHGGGITECLEGFPATQFTDYNIPKNIVMMIDIGIFGYKEGFGLRHEDEYMIDNDGNTTKYTDLPIRVYK